ncbi:MAG: transglutaminase family protein [Actinomycetota bacterium]
MRLDIRYRMTFQYDSPVREAHNELRVRPRDLPSQRLLAHRLSCDPAARILSFTDYWGTTVDHLGVVFEHDEFEIVAEAAVETRPVETPDPLPVAALDDQRFRLDHAEELAPSPHVLWDEAIAELGRDAVVGVDDLTSLVQATVEATRSVLTYERNSTRIGIPLTDLVAGGRGVCQDYAHLNIGLLRAVGVPARYVSGYLFAVDETRLDDDAQVVAVQTHAWVEAGLPDGSWLPVDPTNNQPVGERHVVIGHGRDYDDVAPVRGVYAGEAVPAVDATVEIRRMNPVERMMTSRPRRRSRPAPYLAPPDAAVEAQQQQQQ